MSNPSLIPAILGIYIGFLMIISGNGEAGIALTTSVLSGFYGFLQKNNRDKKYWSPEVIIVIYVFGVCALTYYLYSNSIFLEICTIFGNTISGFFGVSLGSNYLVKK